MRWPMPLNGEKARDFVTPLLAVLEQNAKVVREYIGDDVVVLEHHSNVIRTEDTGNALDIPGAGGGELARAGDFDHQ